MLVLTRSCDEEIRIGDEIVVRVLDVKGDRVRIGIQAPSEVSVHRQEVYAEIERANQESLNVAASGLSGAKELLGGAVKSATRLQSKGKSPITAKSSVGRRVNAHTEVSHGT
ncbi:MAG: carbon storage regulator CsrA [Planctomycetota bacterium]